MRLIYDIGIRIYSVAARILALWNPKAGQWVKGRQGWEPALRNAFGSEDKVVWFHCASLGEFEQGRPVMEALRAQCPEYRILLTFFSPSGYEKRKDYPGADHVMYLPADTAGNAEKLISSVPLVMVIFIKYEFWYHYLNRLKKHGTPVYLASGIFRSGQLFFRWYGGWYKRFLENFTHIFVQEEHSAGLLKEQGFRNVTVAGDTRFDRVITVAKTPYEHAGLEEFTRNHQVVVAGSTWEADEELLEHACRDLPDEIRWIIAPHELSESHLRQICKRFPRHVLFTQTDSGIPEGTRVVIVDTIGQLSYLYRYGTLAYIGGGFGKGIHNILEAATYSLPVTFGPRYQKFREAVDLVQQGGAFPVRSHIEFLSTIRQQLHSESLLKTCSETAGSYVKKREGASSVIVGHVCKKTDANMLQDHTRGI